MTKRGISDSKNKVFPQQNQSCARQKEKRMTGFRRGTCPSRQHKPFSCILWWSFETDIQKCCLHQVSEGSVLFLQKNNNSSLQHILLHFKCIFHAYKQMQGQCLVQDFNSVIFLCFDPTSSCSRVQLWCVLCVNY